MNEINFLPPSYLKRVARQRRIMRQIALLAAVTFCMLGWHFSSAGNLGDLRDYADTLESQVAAAKNQINEMARLKAEHKRLAHQVRIQREIAQPVGHTVIIATIGMLMPDSLAISSLNMDTTRPAMAKAAAPARRTSGRKTTAAPAAAPKTFITIAIVGVAPGDEQVAAFIGKLVNHEMFQNVKLLYSRATEVGEYAAREFRIELQVPLDRDYQFTSQQVAAVDESQSTIEEAGP